MRETALNRLSILALALSLGFALGCDDDPDPVADGGMVDPEPEGDPEPEPEPDAAPDPDAGLDAGPGDDFTLVILHSNDGESALLPGEDGYGGVASYVALADRERQAAIDAGAGVVHVTSGDNFLAGPAFNASLDADGPLFDALALNEAGFDAMCLGNHDFDFGPDVLERFIGDVDGVPFLSANLDFSGEAGLQALVDDGRIAARVVVETAGERVGIVGATTESLNLISSPRGVAISPVGPAVQAEVDALTADGVDKIILVSHLQSVNNDVELAATLTGIDVVIAGGGDDLLAREDSVLIPGDARSGDYPLEVLDADGNAVPVVTTSGQYRYLGRLMVTFDADGVVTAVDPTSGPLRVAPASEDDGIAPDPTVLEAVNTPLEAALAEFEVGIGLSQVDLDGLRGSVRTVETNLGNLVADALTWQAAELAAGFGAEAPVVGLQNGGGMRNDSVIPAGDLTVLDTFAVLPFPNFVSIVEGIDGAGMKAILELAVSGVEDTSGRFAQVSGLTFEYDPAGSAREIDDDGNVIEEGARVITVTLDDGTVLVEGGEVTADGMAASFSIATIDFLARGGDGYPFPGSFTTVGVTYQQALQSYIEGPLAGVVSAADYPVGGEGRITASEVAAKPPAE